MTLAPVLAQMDDGNVYALDASLGATPAEVITSLNTPGHDGIIVAAGRRFLLKLDASYLAWDHVVQILADSPTLGRRPDRVTPQN